MGQSQSLQSFTAVEMREQVEETVENLEKGPNIVVQTEEEVPLAQTPLLENFTSIEMHGKAEETDENEEQGPTVASQAGIEKEKSTPFLQKFTGEHNYLYIIKTTHNLSL